MNNIFEKAARTKLRFQTARGSLSVEQLWDLPLESGEVNLYKLAEELLGEVSTKPAKKLSFFKKSVSADETAELRFEIVKYIVVTRVAEIEEKTNKAVVDSEKRELDQLIAAKEQEAKGNLSLEELKAARAKLS